MSVKYSPVQWTRSKIFYDIVLALMVVSYILIYIRVSPQFLDHARLADDAIVRARAFGTCAFFMLTVILCIGPLARLDRRFLPLLYNRRHFGVLTFFVALTHMLYVLDWYFNFSPIPRLEAMLSANTSYGHVLGFPFETLGVLSLLALAILAATSHDFWLRFLTAPVWKSLHYLLYAAYALLVGHVALGSLQSENNPTFAIVVGASVLLVCGLHIAAAWREHRLAAPGAREDTWYLAGDLKDFEEGRAKIVNFGNGRRAAVFLYGGKLSAISNACAHQNGPLGEGRITGSCVTCPWHGFEYRLEDGRSPEPFTERVPTYNLRLDGTSVLVNAVANPPGTFVQPLEVAEQVV